MKALRKIAFLLVLALIVAVIPASVASAVSRPARPTEVRVAATALGISVKWDAIRTAEKYEIQRREMNGTEWGAWETLLSIKENEYTDPNVVKSHKYQYRVRAYNSAGWGERKTSSSVVAAEITQKPAASSKITVTNSDSGIVIKWNKIDGAIKYGLYRSEYNGSSWGSWTGVKTLTKTEYTDSDVAKGKQYKYRVRANNKAGWGPYKTSSAVEVPLPLPQAPAKVTAKGESGKIKVTWSSVETAEKYRVYRKEYDGDSWSGWTKLKDTTAKSYTDTNVIDGITYKYTVRAYNKTGWGDKKDSGNVETLTIPVAPASVKLYKENGGIKIKWDAVNQAEKYGLYRRENIDGNWGDWTTVKKLTSTSYLDKEVETNVIYQYRVRAYNSLGWGPYKTSSETRAMGIASQDRELSYPEELYANNKEKALEIILGQGIEGKREATVIYPKMSSVLTPEQIEDEIPVFGVEWITEECVEYKNAVKIRYFFCTSSKAYVTYAIRFNKMNILDDDQKLMIKDVKSCLTINSKMFEDAKTDFEKVNAIHDLIMYMDSNIYNEDCYYRTIMNMRDGHATDIFQAFCVYNGLKCVSVGGESVTGSQIHWNQVKVSGKWYNVDEANAIELHESYYSEQIPYISFLKSDAAFSTYYDPYDFHKQCTSKTYDLLGLEDYVVSSIAEAKQNLTNQKAQFNVNSGSYTFILVYDRNKVLYSDVTTAFGKVVGKYDTITKYTYGNGYDYLIFRIYPKG
ncbi:MAG: fibronectin type III domain-containing protein [Lachnospiraceae bacterium]|nr:fibronectin type III domain-containing protein [Lachnospiraceae bacterium]